MGTLLFMGDDEISHSLDKIRTGRWQRVQTDYVWVLAIFTFVRLGIFLIYLRSPIDTIGLTISYLLLPEASFFSRVFFFVLSLKVWPPVLAFYGAVWATVNIISGVNLIASVPVTFVVHKMRVKRTGNPNPWSS